MKRSDAIQKVADAIGMRADHDGPTMRAVRAALSDPSSDGITAWVHLHKEGGLMAQALDALDILVPEGPLEDDETH
jgi:hypothetical protein